MKNKFALLLIFVCSFAIISGASLLFFNTHDNYLQDSEVVENPDREDDTNNDAVTLDYTATVYFYSNCSDTVTNMPKTASSSAKLVLVEADGCWSLNVTIGQEVPSRTGYTFKNWNTSSGGTGTSYNPGASVSVKSTGSSIKFATLSLYAQWTQLELPTSYTVNVLFNSNTTEAVSNMPAIARKTSSIISTTIDGSWTMGVQIGTNIPERNGYRFLSWNENESGTGSSYAPGATIYVGESSVYVSFARKTLYAQWEKLATPTVYFNGNGGTPSQSSKVVTYSYAYGDLATATRDGYSFAGWWTASSGGSQVYSTTIVNNSSNHTLYAHWNKNVYTIDINILNPNGEQDYESGTIDIYYSYSSNSYTGKTDQPESSCDYLGIIKISNITPTIGYYLSSVTCNNGSISQSGSTYTYTATMKGTPNGSWDDVITIQMLWKEFPVDIRIVNMYGEENGEYGFENGTVNLQYSDGVVVSNAKSEYNVNGQPKTLRNGWTIKISNIIPSSSFQFKSVSADIGSLVDNKDGSYTFTVDFGNEANGTTATIIVQMTALFYDEDEGYFYMENGEYPQSYAAVEWDEYSGDGVYNGARITYNSNTKVLTLDGTLTGGTGTILRTHGITFSTGIVYTVYREYIGGSFSIQNNTGTSMVIDTIVKGSDNNPSTRNYDDAGIGNYNASYLTINQQSANEADGFKFWIWLNSGTTVTFDNYQIRILICYDNILINSSLTSVGTIANPIDNSKELIVYKTNNAIADMPAGSKFVQLNNRWFKVEPIRWKLTDFATDLSITTSGGWEIIGQAVNVKANTDYTLKLNYSVPNYTPLSGYNGLAFMVLSSSPTNDECKSKSLSYCELPTQKSSGEAILQFNSGNNTTVYIVLNFGYIADGSTYSFKFGYLRFSDKSINFEKDIMKWNKYFYANAFSLSEDNIVKEMGISYNIVAVTDKILTIGVVESDLSTINEGWSFTDSELYSYVNSLNSFMNVYSDMWTIYYDQFGEVGQQDKVEINYDIFYDVSEPWISSIEEVNSKNFAGASAKGSDFVCFILGCNSEDNVRYWTRNLGTNLDNGIIVASSGVEKSNWLNNVNGVRLSAVIHW